MCPQGMNIVRLDLSERIPADLSGVDCIVHCAGALPYRNNTWCDYVQDNVDSMRNLLKYAKATRVKKFIYLSTIGIYGEFRRELIDEDADIINPPAYGITKLVAERLLQESGIMNVSLRMPGIIGPGARGIWFTNVYEKFKKNETVKIYNPGFRSGNFVDVDDLADFVSVLVVAETYKYGALNLACRDFVSVWEFVRCIKAITKSSSEIEVVAGNRMSFRLDPTRAYSMGYASRKPLEILEHYHNQIRGKNE